MKYAAQEKLKPHETLKARFVGWLVEQGHDIIAIEHDDVGEALPEIWEDRYFVDIVSERDGSLFLFDAKGSRSPITGNACINETARDGHVRITATLGLEVRIVTEDGRMDIASFTRTHYGPRTPSKTKPGTWYYLYPTHYSREEWG